MMEKVYYIMNLDKLYFRAYFLKENIQMVLYIKLLIKIKLILSILENQLRINIMDKVKQWTPMVRQSMKGNII